MKKFLIGLVVALGIFNTAIVIKDNKPEVSQFNVHQHDDISKLPMPIALDHPLAKMGTNLAPIEIRDESVRKYISAGVRIANDHGEFGSGTIVYYDSKDNIAWIQSCGHLFNGNMSGEEGKKRNMTCKITTWYHNNEKLAKPQDYTANVHYYSNGTGRDISLLSFKPDWKPDYFPIAPSTFVLPDNTSLISIGCDGAREIAAYNVKSVGLRGGELVTNNNSPRPGRSGGGLLTTNDLYIGICVRTSDVSGNGIGLFTPLQTVISYNKNNGYGWLNEVGTNWARQLPIVDRNNKQNMYDKDYIPLPNR